MALAQILQPLQPLMYLLGAAFMRALPLNPPSLCSAP
jgi:hypothetical protein